MMRERIRKFRTKYSLYFSQRGKKTHQIRYFRFFDIVYVSNQNRSNVIFDDNC